MQTFSLSRRALLTSSALLVASPAFGRATVTYRDPRAPVAMRVEDLLRRMMLEEKVAQIRCMWVDKGKVENADASFSTELALKVIPEGIGHVGIPHDRAGSPDFESNPVRSVRETIDYVNAVQKFHVERTRLGIPAMFHVETAHGLAAPQATVFPTPPGLASTWDPDLVEQAYAVGAREARARGSTLAFGPLLDLVRDPRYGRSEEFFSEDPYLTGCMGVASARGQQGATRPLGEDRIFVTLKHFVHGVPQGGINLAPSGMSERELRETYLPPFAAVIAQTDPAGIMPSYNEVGGIPSHANIQLLQDDGRDLLKFKGTYFSDYWGIRHLVDHHRMAATNAEAAVLAMKAGVDVDFPDGDSYVELPGMVRAGKVSMAQIDAAVRRVLALKFEAKLFENPFVDENRVRRDTNRPADVALARKAAEKSLTLLTNDGVLPLDPAKPVKLAVIGPNASPAWLGGFAGSNDRAVSILEGLRRGAPNSVSIGYAEGVRIVERDLSAIDPTQYKIKPVRTADNDARIAEAVALASAFDVIVLAVGDHPAITREARGPEKPGDRDDLGLYGDQNKLVEALLVTGKPIIALLISGRPLAVPRLAAKANALVAGWYLGQEGGSAFADMLFGRINPGGKLPVSIPRSAGDLPVFYNRHTSADANIYVGGAGRTLFDFGHGLSYTSFDIAAPRLRAARIRVGDPVDIEVDVTNTGQRVGDEVVQIYIADDVSSAPRPILELREFKRVTLSPGERQTLTFRLDAAALAFWDIDMQWRVEPGSFTISCGNSSSRLKSAKLTVEEAFR